MVLPCLNRSWLHFIKFILLLSLPNILGAANISWPQTVKIGALLAFNSTIGAGCLGAVRLAVENINNDLTLLNDTKLVLEEVNSNCSAFQGAAAATDLFAAEVLAIAGPQTSVVSHFVAQMAAAVQVPLVSFSATDPSLSAYQYPYFIRLTHSDSVQMAAVAGVINFYGWREVVTLFTDDDYGKNGINALSDFLDNVGTKIVYKAGLDPAIDKYGMGSTLAQLAQMECKVFVVHMQPSVGCNLFSMASYLKMVTAGYVWIVTEDIASILDTMGLDDNLLKATQGIIGTRSYVPDSPRLQSFLQQRYQLTGSARVHVNPHELYAYDSVLMIGYALDSFLRQGGSIEFISPKALPAYYGGNSDLAHLRVFKNGPTLLSHMLENNFTGISGFVQLDRQGDLMGSSFEVVNMVGNGLHVVGYWTNGTGCSLLPPDDNSMIYGSFIKDNSDVQKLHDVIWPGGVSQVPHGWVASQNGRPLLIGVPFKTGYKEFVSTTVDNNNVTTFHGFCIAVFEAAIAYLPYAVPYNFVAFGDGSSTPNYDELVEKVANKEFDAVVGDVTITTKRSKAVDFTQPYTASGLVVVVPVKGDASSYAWAFMQPFTPAMWCTTGAFFLFTGIVIWMLEHKKNRDFRGRPKKQIVTTLWFIFSTLFFSQREKVKSTLGRAVLIIWLFVVLIVISSYTASLTSILTVQQLMPTIQGIAGLVASTVPIGFQAGSFVEEYLLQLNVARERLVPLSTLASYAKALLKGPRDGGIGAIVDELPYVQLFLSYECDFTITGQAFTKSGWGFAFPKGSQLAIDMSTAILTLAENGELQRIYDSWLSGHDCSSNVQVQSNELSLSSFWGLFLITGVVSIICVVVYFIRMVWQYHQRSPIQQQSQEKKESAPSRFSRGAAFLRSFASFIEEADLSSDRAGSSSHSNKDSTKGRLSIESIPTRKIFE